MDGLSGAIAGINAIKDIGKSKIADRDKKLIEKETKLLEEYITGQKDKYSKLQDKNSDLRDKNDEIKEELSKIKKEFNEIQDWNNKKNRYELKDVYSSGFVLSLRQECHEDEIHHYACSQCAEKNQFIIVLSKRNHFLYCTECKNTIQFEKLNYP